MQITNLNAQHIRDLCTHPCCHEKRFVVGEGNTAQPCIMLVGEAPGAQEALLGRPFVGKAGKNLDVFLEQLELKRDDIYITNVVKIRPTATGTSGRVKNRPPTRQEVDVFLPWLMQEIQLIMPKMLVTLGNTPLKAMLGADAVIGEMHGKLRETLFGTKLFPLYHPAAIIYNRALTDVYHSDIAQLQQVLAKDALA